MDIILKVSRVLSVYELSFQGLSKASLPYPNINYLFASLKLLTYLNPPRIIFSVIGRYSPVSTPHWLERKCAGINLSNAASVPV
jgi:hypothetical protein